jgi:hypothetical protein
MPTFNVDLSATLPQVHGQNGWTKYDVRVRYWTNVWSVLHVSCESAFNAAGDSSLEWRRLL